MKTMTLDDLLKNPLTENDKKIIANARVQLLQKIAQNKQMNS